LIIVNVVRRIIVERHVETGVWIAEGINRRAAGAIPELLT
jgi:hypothetical protein